MEAVVAIWARKLNVIRQPDLVKRVLDNQSTKRDEYLRELVNRNLVQGRLYTKYKNINFRNSFYLYRIKIGMIVENYVVVVKTREPVIDVYA